LSTERPHSGLRRCGDDGRGITRVCSRVRSAHDFSQSHPNWFLLDGIHLTPAGQSEYASFLRDAISAPVTNGVKADAAITYAYEHFFDPALSAAQRAALIEGGDTMRAFIDRSFAAHASEAAAGAIVVDQIDVHGATADVSFHALLNGRVSPANPGRISGTAVLEAGTWKIGRATYCVLSANDGEPCPGGQLHPVTTRGPAQ